MSTPTALRLNQFVLYAERLPDSVQRDHIDWGFHLTALYGTDYRYTFAKGYFSDQWLDDHHQYGFDPTLEYVDLYLPHVAQGMNLRLGRFHLHSWHRGPACAEQLHLQPFAAVLDRPLYRYRAICDDQTERSMADAARYHRQS